MLKAIRNWQAIRGAVFAALVVGIIASVSHVAPVIAQSGQQMGLVLGTNWLGWTKHFVGGGPTPQTCTNCTMSTGSSDLVGKFTTSSTTAGFTFSQAYTTAPACFVAPSGGTTPGSGTATQPTYHTTTTALHADVIANTTIYSYWCATVTGG